MSANTQHELTDAAVSNKVDQTLQHCSRPRLHLSLHVHTLRLGGVSSDGVSDPGPSKQREPCKTPPDRPEIRELYPAIGDGQGSQTVTAALRRSTGRQSDGSYLFHKGN